MATICRQTFGIPKLRPLTLRWTYPRIQFGRSLNVKRISCFVIFIVFALCSNSNLAIGSGILLEGLGTRAVTMGGAFIGLADDSSAIFWNPGGLARLKGGKMDIGVYTMTTWMKDRNSVSNLYPPEQNPAKGDVFPRVYDSEPSRFDEENAFWPFCATIPSITAYKSYDNFTIGGGVYGAAGAYSKWDDKIRDSSGADIRASIWSMLMIMDFNFSIATKITDKLSLGVGVDLLYARLKADGDKDYRGSSNPLQPNYSFRLEHESTGMGLQGTIGCLYEFSPKLSLGAVYRTGAKFDLEGDTYARLTPFIGEEKSDHYHEFVYPPSWGIGIAYKPYSRLTLTADWQRTDFTEFNWPNANFTFENQGVLLRDMDVDPDWFASNAYRFGLEYQYSERLTLRGGYFREDSGIPPDGEGLATISIGDPIQYANVGFGYQWDVWHMDFMVGTMWGETTDSIVEHQ